MAWSPELFESNLVNQPLTIQDSALGHAPGGRQDEIPVLGDGRFERDFRVGAPLGGQPVETDRVDDRMWAPTSEPFSRTTTDRLAPSCFSRIAAPRPAGPAPTMTTSNSIDSRTGSSLEDPVAFLFSPLAEDQAAAHGAAAETPDLRCAGRCPRPQVCRMHAFFLSKRPYPFRRASGAGAMLSSGTKKSTARSCVGSTR